MMSWFDNKKLTQFDHQLEVSKALISCVLDILYSDIYTWFSPNPQPTVLSIIRFYTCFNIYFKVSFQLSSLHRFINFDLPKSEAKRFQSIVWFYFARSDNAVRQRRYWVFYTTSNCWITNTEQHYFFILMPTLSYFDWQLRSLLIWYRWKSFQPTYLEVTR